MSASVIRKWTDVGAPTVWATNYGDIAKLLKTVLVDGYGAFAPLGWTLEATAPDGNTMIFRNDPVSGSGTYLEVNHSENATNGNARANVCAWESFSDISEGLGRTPPEGQINYVRCGLNASAACPDGIHWMVIGDNKGIWLCFRAHLSDYADISAQGRIWWVYYFGDYIPVGLTNRNNFFVSGCAVTTAQGAFGTTQSVGTQAATYWVSRNSSISPGSQGAGIDSGTQTNTAKIGGGTECFLSDAGLHFCVPSVHSTDNHILGWLPGLFNPLRAEGIAGVVDAAIADQIISLSDRDIYVLRYQTLDEAYNLLPSIGLSVGEGFRDVL